ncbi:MAG: hypothetical protein DID90_2727552516 [Candidatus Nitrotoga sp. LAW]|nr:MAG: hypothetical protein DID90_2727552516 [Candidatus Nitrotoga sp. LAW]
MTTKTKNPVKAKPVAKSKVVTKSLPAKAVVNNKPKPVLTAKAVAPKKVPAKIANKNIAEKTVATPLKVVIAEKLSKKADKPKKIKMVRDSFTMPVNEYSQFAALKRKCQLVGVYVKKSELLRAGLLCLSKLSDPELVNVVGQVEILKTGRPTKH